MSEQPTYYGPEPIECLTIRRQDRLGGVIHE